MKTTFCDLFSEFINVFAQLQGKDCDCASWGDMIVFSMENKDGQRRSTRMYKKDLKKFIKKCDKKDELWLDSLIKLTLD